MIRLENISKYAVLKDERKAIIDHASVTMRRGRSVGLLGRNGAGKSTLLQIIAGSLAPDSGRVVKKGKVSWPLGFKDSFQGNMTGAQNVRFVARIYGMDTAELTDYVEDFAELGAFFNEPVRTYSSGMKARLAFGVSMGIKFDYYLVDEITAVGDSNFKKKCNLVFRERLSDSDVIMVSHSISTIREYCDSGVVLEAGKLTLFDDVNDAIKVHERNMEKSQ